MTTGQRRLVWGWVAALSLLVGFLIAGHVLTTEGLRWLRFLLLPFILLARLAIPLQEAEAEGRANINEVADDAPWVKWWAVLCAVFFFCGAIYVTRSAYRIEDEHIIDFVIISFAVMLGPLVYVAQRQRFRELAE
jgi:hypothetical protein